MHIFANAMRQSGSDDIAELLPRVLGSEITDCP